MEVTEHALLRIADGTAVGEARRVASELAGSLGLDANDAGRAALVATEVATNLVKHAGDPAHLVEHARALGPLEMEELGGVPLEDQHHPARKELIVVEIGDGRAEIGDPMVGRRPIAGAERARAGCNRRVERKR